MNLHDLYVLIRIHFNFLVVCKIERCLSGKTTEVISVLRTNLRTYGHYECEYRVTNGRLSKLTRYDEVASAPEHGFDPVREKVASSTVNT